MFESTEEELANAFLEKAKISDESPDAPHQERDDAVKEAAELRASSSAELEKKRISPTTTEETSRDEATEKPTPGLSDFEVEIIRGPPPNSLKGRFVAHAPTARRLAQSKEEGNIPLSLQVTEEGGCRAGEDTTAVDEQSGRVGDVITTSSTSPVNKMGFHAIIPINDWPWRERWRVTNKEIMARLIDMTGAAVTYGGMFYQHNKGYPAEGPPKLHLLIESNEEWRVEQAVQEIKQLVVEAATTASVLSSYPITTSRSKF